MMMRNLPRNWWLSSRALTFATGSKSWVLQFHSNTASWWWWRQSHHHHAHSHPHHHLHHRHHQKWFLVCCFPRDLDPLTTQLSWEKNKETAEGKKWKSPWKGWTLHTYSLTEWQNNKRYDSAEYITGFSWDKNKETAQGKKWKSPWKGWTLHTYITIQFNRITV